MDEMIKFFLKNYERMGRMLNQHVYLVICSFLLSLVIAFPFGILAAKKKKIAPIINNVFNIIFSVPSMAMYALLIPVSGLGSGTAIIVLAIYNQIILVRNIVEGFDSVDKTILEAGKGMGLGSVQLFFKVELPLAIPKICTGFRLALLSTISTATLAAVINSGGIGDLLFAGLRQQYFIKIYWGTILAAILALITSLILRKLENYAIAKANGEVVKKNRKHGKK